MNIKVTAFTESKTFYYISFHNFIKIYYVVNSGHVYRELSLCRSSRWLLGVDHHGSGSIYMLLNWENTSRMFI